jgi:topoisomerase IA-like protein
VPRGLDPAALTLDEAVGLLRAKAEQGPAKVRKAAKKAAKKPAKKAAKKVVKKAAKKATKKAAKPAGE